MSPYDPKQTCASLSDVALGAVSLVLIFDQLKALVAAVKEQAPKGAAAKDASRLLECEERDQRDEEDGGVSYDVGSEPPKSAKLAESG